MNWESVYLRVILTKYSPGTNPDKFEVRVTGCDVLPD